MNCLVLYIDLDFIAGIVHVNGQAHPVAGSEEVFLWLYFFNNQHGNTVTYGRNNKIPFDKGEPNYYGRFFELIQDDAAVFPFGGIQRPAIELLKVSGLLDAAIGKYMEVTLEVPEQIPTLISFAPSMSDSAKHKITTYLRQTSFDMPSPIFSQTKFNILADSVSPAELAAHYCRRTLGEHLVNKGDNVLFLKATNSSLRLMTLVLAENYFSIRHDRTLLYPERGIDPRKRAICNFVVNEINNYTGVLFSIDEKKREIEWFEQNKAESWLQQLDSSIQPMRIYDSFQITPNMHREALVWKNIIEQNTGHYIQGLVDILDHYRHGTQNVAAIIFWGDCFRNSRVREKFAQTIAGIPQIFHSSADIYLFLSAYPSIDYNHPLTPEEEAKKLYDNALEQFNRGELTDALANVESALEKTPVNDSCMKLLARVKDKIKEKDNKARREKLIAEATSLQKDGKLKDALGKFEEAMTIFYSEDLFFMIRNAKTGILLQKYNALLAAADSDIFAGNSDAAANSYAAAKRVADEIKDPRVINEVKDRIEALEAKVRLRNRYESLLSEGDALFLRDDCDAALSKYREAQKIEDTPQVADKIAAAERVRQQREHVRQQQLLHKSLIDEGDALLLRCDFDAALDKYREARQIDPTPQVADKIAAAERARQQHEKNLQRYKILLDEADLFYSRGDYDDAARGYDAAKQIAEQIRDVVKIREIENRTIALDSKVQQRKRHENLIAEADERFARDDFDAALIIYREARTIENSAQAADKIAAVERAIKQREHNRQQQLLHKTLIEEGDALFLRDDCPAALLKYREAQKIDPTPQVAEKIALAERVVQQREQNLTQYRTLLDEIDTLCARGDYNAAANCCAAAKQFAEQLKDTLKIREVETRIRVLDDKILQRKQAEALIAQANEILANNDCDAALNKYREAQKIDPTPQIAEKIASVERARQERQHSRQQQQRSKTLMEEAEALILDNSFDAALIKYREARKIDPSQQIADKIAAAERARQQYEHSLQRYKTLLDEADALYARSDFGPARDKYESARQIAEQINDTLKIRETETRIRTLETNILHRKQTDALIAEAESRLARNDYDAALDKYREAYKIDPAPQTAEKIAAVELVQQQQEHSLQQRQNYQTTLEEGINLYLRGEYSAALNKYVAAKQIAEQIKYLRGIRETEARIYVAEQNLREQKQKEQQHNVLLNEANILFLHGNCEEALEKYKKANEIINSPESANGMAAVEPILRITRKAEELLKNGKIDEAEKACNSALSIHPACSAAKKHLETIARYRDLRAQADNLIKEQKPQEALKKYREAQTVIATAELDLRISLVASLTQMLKQADRFLEQGFIDEAEKSYNGFLKTCRDALAINPNHAHSETQLSKIEKYRELYAEIQRLEKEQKWAEAIERCEKARKLIPNTKIADKIDELSKRLNKFCNSCGAPILNPNNRFCNKCGKPVK
jgi:tetratricopeptide (TPR) repeat protein